MSDKRMAWLGKNAGNAAKGLDALVGKMFSDLRKNPSYSKILKAASETPHTTYQLSVELGIGLGEVQGALTSLGEYRLVEPAKDGYIATSFGKNALNVLMSGVV